MRPQSVDPAEGLCAALRPQLFPPGNVGLELAGLRPNPSVLEAWNRARRPDPQMGPGHDPGRLSAQGIELLRRPRKTRRQQQARNPS